MRKQLLWIISCFIVAALCVYLLLKVGKEGLICGLGISIFSMIALSYKIRRS